MLLPYIVSPSPQGKDDKKHDSCRASSYTMWDSRNGRSILGESALHSCSTAYVVTIVVFAKLAFMIMGEHD